MEAITKAFTALCVVVWRYVSAKWRAWRAKDNGEDSGA